MVSCFFMMMMYDWFQSPSNPEFSLTKYEPSRIHRMSS